MPFTIQQGKLANKVADSLVDFRRGVKNECVRIKTVLDTYNVAQYALDQAKQHATNLGAFLDFLLANQAEITAAATAVGYSDFTERYQALRDAQVALAGANTGNIGARLQAIINGLPDETIF